MAPCASTNPGEFPEDHLVEVYAGIDEYERSPGNDSDDAEEELCGSRGESADLQRGKQTVLEYGRREERA